MKQGFRLFRITSRFEEEVEEFCKTYYIKKWEITKSKNIMGEEIILVEYRDKFLDESETTDKEERQTRCEL